MNVGNAMPKHRFRNRELLSDLALFTFCLLCFLHVPFSLVDDAFIAYRYGANLAHGLGLVFNPGQRVEGFSDLSWTVLMSVPELLHFRPEVFGIGVAAVSGALSFCVGRRVLVSRAAVSPLTAFAIFCMAAFSCDFWVMAGNGIESGLYALILMLSFAAFLSKRYLWTGILLGFATTLRPESMSLAPVCLLCVGGMAFRETERLDRAVARMWDLRSLMGSWAMIVMSVLFWRHSYYGSWIQNTIVAKSHPLHFSDISEGIFYIAKFCARNMLWVVTSAGVLFNNPPIALLVALLWFAAQMILVIPNSGDWMPGYRLLSVYIPLMACCSAFTVDLLIKKRLSQVRWLLPSLLVLCVVVQLRDRRWTLNADIIGRHQRTDMLRVDDNSFIQMAEALKPVLSKTDVVSPEVLGVFSYLLLNVPMHDYLGLADAHVARHGTVFLPMFGKADPSYSVETVKPTVFVFIRGDATIQIFERGTAQRFGKLYSFWLVVNRPERIMLAVRRDREAPIIAAVQRSALQLERYQP